jgi:hypothetical protein
LLAVWFSLQFMQPGKAWNGDLTGTFTWECLELWQAAEDHTWPWDDAPVRFNFIMSCFQQPGGAHSSATMGTESESTHTHKYRKRWLNGFCWSFWGYIFFTSIIHFSRDSALWCGYSFR